MASKILYVEDNPANMLLVRRIVEAAGYDFLAAEDGPAGWQMAVAWQPDLILMDLQLPGDLSGFELTRLIKQDPATAHIPVVALTSFGNQEAERAALEAGCVGFLSKPADIRQIQALFHQYLGPVIFPQDSIQSTVASSSYI